MLRRLTANALLFSSLWALCGQGSSSKDDPGAAFARRDETDKTAFIDAIVAKMSMTDMGMVVPCGGLGRLTPISVQQLHMTFANNIVGPASTYELYGANVHC